MTLDCLKVTTYFGERKRAGRALVADALLDLYARHRVETSILLRGVEGYGVEHGWRTDTSLSLSEDLPAVSIALDTPARIEALLRDVAALPHCGLITVERARVVEPGADESGPADGPGGSLKLTTYLRRQDRARGLPAYRAVCELMHGLGLSGACVFLGVDGTLSGHRKRASFFSRNGEVPLMVVTVGPAERVRRAMGQLADIAAGALTTLERVQICKHGGDLLGPPSPVAESDAEGMGTWQKLTVYSRESQRVDGMPVHQALVRRLRQADAAGATTLRGVWGFSGASAPHGDRFFQLARDVPTTTIVVDRPSAIAATFPVVDEVTRDHGLVTSEIVPALRTSVRGQHHGGLRLAGRLR